ncbi:MAG: SLATT domain-containing protein [Leptolyngbya sp. SIO3F4]|nr:SLATT domain-containing protein [Leptolyngbya sp. SIO3F4]
MAPYENEKLPDITDDICADIVSAEDYLQERLDPQFEWYRKKAKKLARQLQMFQTGVYIFGGLGTLVAVSPFKGLVAVTTALGGACTSYLEFKRVEVSLVGYNQAADSLYDIRAWWCSLTNAEKGDEINFSKLVSSCESVINSENASWLQDMQDSLSQLYGQSEEDSQRM